MDSEKQRSPRKLRGRSKSSGGDAPASDQEEEMARNVNGNKDGGVETAAAASTEGTPESQEDNGEKGTTGRTRKRKAAEMKSDDSSEESAKKPASDDAVKETSDEANAPVEDVMVQGTIGRTRKRKAAELKTDDSSEESAKKPISDDVEVKQESIDEPTLPVEVKVEVTDESATDSPSDIKDITISSEKHALGKGKRARIPNKRYSDITPLKAVSFDHSKSKHSENGQAPDNDLTEILREESEAESHSLRRSVASPAGHTTKKQKASVDLSNPNYLKPFEFGWKRELVYRANTDSSMKRNGDIYYYTPHGKKVRSMREVAENLTNRELSIDDFTFFKEPLGVDDPEKEIIRDAKFKTAGIVSDKVTPRKVAKTPKVGSPRVVSTTESPAADSPKTGKPSRANTSLKVKIPKAPAKKEKKSAKDESSELEMGTYPPSWTSPQKKGKTNNYSVDSKPCQPCSIRCEGVTGLIPTLQCRLCLCLYHNECVGIQPHANIQGYVCKNCRKPDTNTSAAPLTSPPPPLTPVNTLKPIQTGVLPKLQRIPKPADIDPLANLPPILPDLPKLTPKPGIANPQQSEIQNTRSILGSVTTWFPPSSTIQVGNTESSDSINTPAEPPRPQLVEIVGNKKYLIVPRHNILSVAPPNPSLPACDIKLEPDGSPDKTNTPPETIPPSDQQDGTEEATILQPLTTSTTTTTTTSQEKPDPKGAKAKPNTRGSKATTSTEETKQDASKPMDTYLQNLVYGYKTLLYVFQYLKVQDLLRAGCVCTMWRDVARHSLLWRTVRMKNSQIHSFEGLANALQNHGTVHLDLRKMLLPTTGGDDIWPSFTNAIKKVESLRKIELCRCLASVVEELANNNHNLEAINAVTIKCESMSFEPFRNLKNLTDLRIKSTAGLTLTSDLSALRELTKMKHLSITSIKDLNKLNIDVIGELVNLEVLDIGECADFPATFGPEILSKLSKLEKLRLEKGQGECHTFDILEAVKDLGNLHQLELVNFDIKFGFDKALGACKNIKKLLIIPTYISQSATTNHMVLGGVLKLQKTLSHFVWGVTLELLRVTELFVDQCEQPDKKDVKEKSVNSGDSIPILKPVPLYGMQEPETPPGPDDAPQVDILPLPNLQKLLLQNLPTTRVKILKIPFHATWRQSITESVN